MLYISVFDADEAAARAEQAAGTLLAPPFDVIGGIPPVEPQPGVPPH